MHWPNPGLLTGNRRPRAVAAAAVRWLAGAVLFGVLGGPVMAESRHDYLVFLDAGATHRSGDPVGDELKADEGTAEATFVYSWQGDDLRFFVEVNAGDGGEYELARLQAGWRFAPQTTAWVGRFHNPQSYWNTQYHHGQYLQTSISRPGIEEFDDAGGVIPSHFVGAQLDSAQRAGRGGSLHYELGLGASGDVDENGLESPQLIGPERPEKLTASLRLTYQPQEGDPTSFGVFAGQNRMPAENLPFREVTQTVAGVSANWVQDPLRILGVVFFVHDQLEGGTVPDTAGGFVNGYLQLEYQAQSWTPYARAEGSSGADDDPYLALFPHFVRGRALAGLRLDFGRKQALKLEYARSHIEAGTYSEIGIEWSMVFP